MAIRKISIGILDVLAIAGLLAGVWWFVLGGNKLSSTTPKPDDSTTTTDNATAPPADPTKHDYFEVSTAKPSSHHLGMQPTPFSNQIACDNSCVKIDSTLFSAIIFRPFRIMSPL